MSNQKLGYDDTPYISGSKYRVHDNERPQPPVITPPTETTQASPGTPPSDAIVLFDGSDLSQWMGAEGDAQWTVENGYLQVLPGTGNIHTRTQFGDCQLHLEWAAPAAIKGEGQGRGNSGVFIMGRYEIQVLDCYENPTYADGATAAIYGQCPPLVNPCRKPGEWQVYDIIWMAPRFENGGLLRPAYVTVMLNGIVVHHCKELLGPTKHKVTTCYEEHSQEGPLELQDHGDLVRYRNIWYRPLNGYDSAQ